MWAVILRKAEVEEKHSFPYFFFLIPAGDHERSVFRESVISVDRPQVSISPCGSRKDSLINRCVLCVRVSFALINSQAREEKA